MIFIEDSGKKIWLLVFLVLIFSGLVIWQWFKFNPLQPVSVDENEISLSDTIKNKSLNALEDIKSSLAISQLQMKDLQAEFQRQAKEQALIERTKEYLAKTATSTNKN